MTTRHRNEIEEAARLHIEEIRTRKFFIGKNEPNPLTEDLHEAVTRLSAELYTKDVHFIMELIQNAEDNEYAKGVKPTLEFVITKKDITGSGAPATLLVFNNEIGFTRRNMDSICSVGRSTKKGKRHLGFIGEKGIGFKSVFLVSTEPHIFSNGYQVKFSEEPNRGCGIGYIVPEWVGDRSYVSNIHDVYGPNKALPTSIFVLPLKCEKVKAVETQLSELHPEILLFLSKIKRLSVHGLSGGEVDSVVTMSIGSETNHLAFRDKRADSHVVHLSVKEKVNETEDTCRYYIWRQVFPVKTENKDTLRKDVDEWIILLAFPFGKRLKRGTSSIGIFAFLPTAMVTNFPFVIQADFILASSRETILLDNKWNLGILECVPLAFLDSFTSFVKAPNKLSSLSQDFEFLPAQASSYPVLNNLRESIRTMLQEVDIVPCDLYYGRMKFCRPACVIRILPKFRNLLWKMKNQGIPLDGLSSLTKKILHSSLDLKENRELLDFIGVVSISGSCGWYRQCIKTCNLLMAVPEDVYMELLCFIADNKEIFSFDAVNQMPLLKYIDGNGKKRFFSASKTKREGYKVQYALETDHHNWLIKCNMEFGCPNNIFFLPNSSQKALIKNERSSFLRQWLSSYAGVRTCTVSDYGWQLRDILLKRNEPDMAITFAHFLYHSHSKTLLPDYLISDICKHMPVIDGSGHIRLQRTRTLISASGSNWVKLFGCKNPFSQQDYIDLGEIYAEGRQFAGESTPEKMLLSFLNKYSGALDMPELPPPDVKLLVASSSMTSEQAFLLLDWVRFLRNRGPYIPAKFIESIRDGRWMKTYSGFGSPSQTIIPDETGKIVFEAVRAVLEGISFVDEEYYMNRITLYTDELKFLGVAFGSDDVQKLIANQLKLLSSSGMSRECALSMLTFIGFSKGRKMLDEEWLEVMMKGKWMMTSKGYNAPQGTVFLQSEMEAEAVMRITNLPVVDQNFYGNKIGSFSYELMLLGVVLDSEEVYKLIAENLTFPADLSSITGDSGLLILKCIRYMGSASSGILEKIRTQPWLKTNSGFKRPSVAIFPNSGWGFLLNVVEVPLVDEAYYGNEIRTFKAELEAVGVAVKFRTASKRIVVKFKSLSRSSKLIPANMTALLNYIRQTNKTFPSRTSKICKFLSRGKWLKTRHGLRNPKESILLNSNWGTICLFVDLPLIDDVCYGICIYGYQDEFKMMGVITNFEGGAPFVAKGLHGSIEGLVTAEGSISLLECTKFLMSKYNDQPFVHDFLKNLVRLKWLKTRNGYKTPGECILLDPSWVGILEAIDAPIIDEKLYEIDIYVYKNQLKAIGVKVDFGEVCSLLYKYLSSQTQTSSVTEIYSFLNKFHWNPESHDKYFSQVWIPNSNGTSGGWVSSQLCVLHDRDELFSSRLYSLDKYYVEQLLPIFSSAFGVVEFPSLDDYMQLWCNWVLRENHQVSATECFSFWAYMLDNWNPQTEETLKQNLTKLPATTCTGEDIYLVDKEEVFLADDLQLKKYFLGIKGIPLFVWLPKSNRISSGHARKLYEIYDALGIRKISESVKWNVKSMLSPDQFRKVDPKIGLIGKGLIKIILAFLASPMINMSVEERHKAANSLLDLSVFESDKLIVSFQLLQSSNRTLDIEVKKVVVLEKNSQRLLIDKSCYEDRKTNTDFVICYAQEIAAGLLAQERTDVVDNLRKIIQMGFMFEFKEDAVDTFLVNENLELFREDEEFLDATFPSSEQWSLVLYKRTCQMSRTCPWSPQKRQRK